MRRSHQVTATADEGADASMHGQESLCLPGRVDPAQVSRAVPCGLVGDVGTMVRVSVRALGDGRQDRSLRSPVAAQRVGDHPPRRTRLPLQQRAEQACRRPTVATRLDEAIEDVALLIDGAPERVPPSLDGDEALVQVPDVAQPALSTREPARVYRTNREAPPPGRCVGHRAAAVGPGDLRHRERSHRRGETARRRG